MGIKRPVLRLSALAFTSLLLGMGTQGVHAENRPQLDPAALQKIARQFSTRIPQKFEAADRAMGLNESALAPFPEGEILLFNVALASNVKLENIITAEVHDRTLVFSLRDTVTALELPIQFDGSDAQGWYIRENKKFKLDADARHVTTAEGSFDFPANVLVKDEDVWVPADALSEWFGFTLDPHISQLALDLKTKTPLPVEERIARLGKNYVRRQREKPQLPLHPEPPQALDFPFVDASTRTTFNRPGDGSGSETTREATIATTGDFAYGTLLTQTRLNQEDKVSSVRATYKRETLEPELLGPLKARKYELGDINMPSQPLTRPAPTGLGFRATSVNPLRGTLDANTDITGYALPGWDVELYRGNQLLDTQTVGEDGRYNFPRVELFSNDNDFRVVLYGPQGETREETVYVPVNTDRVQKADGSYDIGVTFDQTQAYSAIENDDEDKGAARLNARFDTPVGDESLANFGLEAGQEDGETTAIAHAGFSTTAMNTLVNVNTGVDEKGESAGELILRRNMGRHNLRNTTQVATKGFDTVNEDDDDTTGHDVFVNRTSLTGPLPIGIGSTPRYNLGVNYLVDAQDEATTSGVVGFNTGFGRLSFNQQFRYSLADELEDDIDSITSLSGSIGRNRLRLASEYEIKPEQQMQNLRANLQRSIGKNLNLDASVERQFQDRLTTGTAQVNWQAGHVLLSPSISYNSDGDVTALLNSRFGALREPQSGDIRMFNHPISLNGGLSVFVYLDQNGNGVHDDGEPPIPKAIIAAPQNGGREETGEDGFAYFSRLQKLILTDVYIEPDSLQDPFWVPAAKGKSILPREGHVSQLAFPVVMAGEVTGTVYTRALDGTEMPARGIPMTIYGGDGQKIMGTVTGADGYYSIAPVPPGDYVLITGGDLMRSDLYQRPAPSKIEIGYNGTMINGNDIYMDEGANDAPLRMLASLDDLKAEQPGLDENALRNQQVILNLGTYHSRMLMSVMWYKARTFGPDALNGLQAFVQPDSSYAAPKTGLHTLRVGGNGLTLEDGTKRCGMLNAAGIKCTLEILPGTLQLAKL